MCGSAAGMGRGHGLSWLRPGTPGKHGTASVAGFGCVLGPVLASTELLAARA